MQVVVVMANDSEAYSLIHSLSPGGTYICPIIIPHLQEVLYYGAEHRTEQGYKALTAPARPFFSSDVIEHATSL